MVKGSKTLKIALDKQGSYLGMEKGCFIVKDNQGDTKRYPLFEKEIGSVILQSGNCVSTGALASLGFWDVDVLITTQRGRPVAMLRSLDNDDHVSTRIQQYEALKDGRGLEIAKLLVLAKIEGQNRVLSKYGLRQFDNSNITRIKNVDSTDLGKVRNILSTYEAHCSEFYFEQVF